MESRIINYCSYTSRFLSLSLSLSLSAVAVSCPHFRHSTAINTHAKMKIWRPSYVRSRRPSRTHPTTNGFGLLLFKWLSGRHQTEGCIYDNDGWWRLLTFGKGTVCIWRWFGDFCMFVVGTLVRYTFVLNAIFWLVEMVPAVLFCKSRSQWILASAGSLTFFELWGTRESKLGWAEITNNPFLGLIGGHTHTNPKSICLERVVYCLWIEQNEADNWKRITSALGSVYRCVCSKINDEVCFGNLDSRIRIIGHQPSDSRKDAVLTLGQSVGFLYVSL